MLGESLFVLGTYSQVFTSFPIRWQEGSLQKQVMASISDMDLGTASDFLSMKNRDCHQNATVYCRKI